MKKPLITLLTFVIFTGLLTYTLLFQRGRVKEKEEIFRTQITSEADIVKVEIIKSDISTVTPTAAQAKSAAPQMVEKWRFVMERIDDNWVASSPFQGFVDPEQVKTLLKTIAELKPSVRKEANLKLADFGLEKPQMVANFGLKNGKTLTINLGNNTSVGGQVYATIAGHEGLFLMPSAFQTDLERDPQLLRERKLAHFANKDVVKVTLTNPKGVFSLEQVKKNEQEVQWKITSPEQINADEWTITAALNKITESEAKDWAPDANNLAAYGLDKPRATVKIELKDGKILEILVGNQVRKTVKPTPYSTDEEERDVLYAMLQGRPEVLLIDATLFDDLDKDVMALRDRKILTLRRENVLGMKVERAKGLNFTVIRDGDDWQIKSPSSGKANRTRVDDLLWDLADLEAKDYVTGSDLKTAGLAIPAAAITLNLKGGKSITVNIGNQVKTGTDIRYYCQTSESKQIYMIGELAMRDLPEKIEDLKDDGLQKSEEPTNLPKLVQ